MDLNVPPAAAGWRKATASGTGNCVEIAWTTAAASGGSNCVEVAGGPGRLILIRHSADPDGPCLAFTQAEWAAFLTGCKGGEFDHLAGHGQQPATPAAEDPHDQTAGAVIRA